MTTDSGQQKEKQSKAKGCLWVIAGVGFIVSVFAALAILGAVLSEPESQPVAQSNQPRATVVPTPLATRVLQQETYAPPTPVATRVYVPPTATLARFALDSDVVKNVEAYHLLVGVALYAEITTIGEIGNAFAKMSNGLSAMDGDMIERAGTDLMEASLDLLESNDAAIQAIKGASDEFDKLPLDRLDKKLVDEVRQYHAFVALSRSETLQYLQDYGEGLTDLSEALPTLNSDSITRASTKTATAIENLKNSNKVAIQAINNASDAFTSLVE